MNFTVNASDLKVVSSALRDYMAHTNRSLPVVLKKQATQLAIGAKGVKGLYQEARSEMAKTKAEIRSLPTRLGYRIKREAGFTVKQEINRRLKTAGGYQSTGWITKVTGKPAGAKVFTERGSIKFSGSGDRLTVTVTNNSKGAGEFAAKTGYVGRALRNRAADMLVYVKNQMASDARSFSRPVKKVTFASISEQLDSLMRVA